MIGRMVIEYGELEWDFCLLVATILQDNDSAIKAMYRSRGESQRISVGDALARNRIADARVRAQYSQTVADMRECLKIRNQYAHTNWVRTASHGLAFVNVEEIVTGDAIADSSNLKLNSLTNEILEDQARFYVGVFQNVRYLNMEMQFVLGESTVTGFHYLNPLQRPLMPLPL